MMKRKRISAIVPGLLTALVLVMLSGAAVHADEFGWNRDTRGWWFRDFDGTYPSGEWRRIGDAWNYFDDDGYTVTGWLQLGGEWYHFDRNGYMQTGWQQLDGDWYYFDDAGVMTTGEAMIDGTVYYFAEDGVMQDTLPQSPSSEEPGAAKARTSNRYVTFNEDGTYTVKNPHIPENAVSSNGHYYYYYDDPESSWNTAFTICFSFGGHLVTITSPQEQEFLESQYPGTQGWIGASCEDGVWKWTRGEPFEYTNWKAGEPNNQNGEEGYAHLYTDMQWNDLPEDDTTYHAGFYCEWDTDTLTYEVDGLFGGQISEETAGLVEEGKRYYFGTDSVEADPNKAWDCFTRATDDYSAEAWYYIGRILSENKTDTYNPYIRAMGAYERAITYGWPAAWLQTGQMYQKGKGVAVDYDKALQLYTIAAELGYAGANAGIGDLYHFGYGVEQDKQMAVEYYKKALQSDDPYLRGFARYCIGFACLYGYGSVDPDSVKAMKWFLAGTDDGSRDCFYEAGRMYEDGLGGVKQNKAMALDYYIKAADLGHQEAKEKIEELSSDNTGAVQNAQDSYNDSQNQGGTYTDSGRVIIDYMQDGTPVYADDYGYDTSWLYDYDYDQYETQPWEDPYFIGYTQDGTPQYSYDTYQYETQPWEDPYFIGYTQDGTPQYAY